MNEENIHPHGNQRTYISDAQKRTHPSRSHRQSHQRTHPQRCAQVMLDEENTLYSNPYKCCTRPQGEKQVALKTHTKRYIKNSKKPYYCGELLHGQTIVTNNTWTVPYLVDHNYVENIKEHTICRREASKQVVWAFVDKLLSTALGTANRSSSRTTQSRAGPVRIS